MSNIEQSDELLVAGFDPGGAGVFGWAVARWCVDHLAVVQTGLVDNAQQAIARVKDELGQQSPAAIGIDAPLFWTPGAGRQVDKTLRDALIDNGCSHAAGTVQHFNSLWGACVVQGIMVAMLARQEWPAVRLTESHPKALLWLSGQGIDGDIAALSVRAPGGLSEHERDAVLGALGAAAMVRQAPGWQDLATIERSAQEVLSPIQGVVEYWMPTDR